MKRIILVCLCLLLVSSLFVSCAKKNEEVLPEGMLRACSAALGLWVFYPENWEIQENGEYLKLVSAEQLALESYTSSADVTDGEAVLPSRIGNVTVLKAATGVSSLEEYEAQYKAQFSDEYVFDGEPQKTEIGKDAAFIYDYHLVGKQTSVLYRFRQALVLHENTVYAITLTASEDLYKTFVEGENLFYKIYSSLTFEARENSPLTRLADAPVPVEGLAQKEGFLALSNQGVSFVLYYPDNGVWSVKENTGFLALTTEDNSSVSVTAGSGLTALITSGEMYLDTVYFPSFDSLYGNRKEISRTEETITDDQSVLTVTYSAEIGGESYSFKQAVYFRRTGYLYSLLYTAKTAEFERHLADVDAMIESLSFR